MKELFSDLIDWFLDWGILIIIFIIFVGLLCYSSIYQENDKQKCKDNGGIVIEHFLGYQCLSKEEINKIRGE